MRHWSRFRAAAAAGVGATVVEIQAVVHACPVCFRFEEDATVSGVRAAVVVLIAVTTAVLAACGLFVVRFTRRAAATPPDEASTS